MTKFKLGQLIVSPAKLNTWNIELIGLIIDIDPFDKKHPYCIFWLHDILRQQTSWESDNQLRVLKREQCI